MSTKTVTINPDGTMTIVKTADAATTTLTGVPPPPRHRSDDHPDPGSIGLGMLLGAGGVLLIQRRRRLVRETRERLDAIGQQGSDKFAERDRMAADVAALARRTATLETIVTDPAHRTAREIEALR